MELLTIAEISKRLELPESTIRSWRDRYAEFIPAVGTGRKRRYEPEAVEVFARIAALSDTYSSSRDVAEQLQASHSRYFEHRNENNSSNSSNTAIDRPVFDDPIYRITRSLEELVKANNDRENLQKRIDELEQRLANLEKSKPFWKRKRTAKPQD